MDQQEAQIKAVSEALEAAEKLRNGPQTSEYRLTVLTGCLGTVLGIYGALKGNDMLVMLGGAMVAGPTGLYSLARGLAKGRMGA